MNKHILPVRIGEEAVRGEVGCCCCTQTVCLCAESGLYGETAVPVFLTHPVIGANRCQTMKVGGFFVLFLMIATSRQII